MKSAIGVSLPVVPITGTWQHAATIGRPGRALRLTPRGSPSASGFIRTRFNPGNVIAPGFEILYLALDRDTALFEKRVQCGDPFGGASGIVIAPRMKDVAVLAVDVDLRSDTDLTDVAAHAAIDTTAQELTGGWQGYEQRGLVSPPVVLTAPTGPAPTQTLGRELFQQPGIEALKVISAKVPTTCCLVIFTHKLLRPNTLMWDDPNTGRREAYP
jgi:hypothetical protein